MPEKGQFMFIICRPTMTMAPSPVFDADHLGGEHAHPGAEEVHPHEIEEGRDGRRQHT